MSVRCKEPNCPFCSIDIEEAVFAVSGDFAALYNISPILPGHSLVIPTFHIASVLELDERDLHSFFSFAQIVTRFLQSVFGGSGFNWTIQDAEVAGQTVDHLHLHIIPRKSGDLPHPGDWYPALEKSESLPVDDQRRRKLTSEQMSDVTSYLRKKWAEGRPS
jgi:bis(5'-adenosyl)-triphosphatase